MSILASVIVGFITGVFILILSYFIAVWEFSFQSGSSPILLEMITFFSLVIGNTIYYTLLSKIFPHIYSRGRTILSQISILSIILYILFFPVYFAVTTFSANSSSILIAFAAHVVINIFTFWLTIGLISQYRYSLLVLYSNIISLLLTSVVIGFISFSLQNSGKAIFILLWLTIVSYFIYGSFSSLISYIYYKIYSSTGFDPLWDIFSRIEMEEKALEKQAESLLTNFSSKP